MEPTQIRHPVGTGSGTEPGRRDKAEKEKEPRGNGVLVIGLGRFGSSIALTLERLGHDVLAVERSPALVQHFTGRFPLVEADATNPEALVQLGVKEFPVAVVGVGTSLEASVLIAGNLVAHLVSGKLLDYIEVEDDFTIVKMRPPRETQGFTVGQSQIRKRYGVTVLGVKSPGADFVYATDETRISADDILIVSGHADLLERFAARP